MTRLLGLVAPLIFCFAASAQVFTPNSVPDVHRADRREFVADPARVLSPDATHRLNSMLDSMRRSLTIEPMIVVVPQIVDPADPSDFATDLFELWGLGKADRDNGLLVLVVTDQRKVTIRPGYGLEGTLPDISCGRIIRQDIAPAFREGDYGRGLIKAMTTIQTLLSDPAAAAEFRSSLPDADQSADGDEDPFRIYLITACIFAALMAMALGAELLSLRGRSDYDKYRALAPWRPVYLALSALGLGIPLIATIPLLLLLNHWRNHRRQCPNCGQAMKKVDEVHDNAYLTPAQDLEERIGSVDYDVWLCPDCGETDIYPYPESGSVYTECPNCHARTLRKTRDRILRQPTPLTAGEGVTEYECVNCRHRHGRPYKIPATGAALAAGAAILGSSGRGGGFSGGSFGGGFGGGHTGGGGATGGW